MGALGWPLWGPHVATQLSHPEHFTVIIMNYRVTLHTPGQNNCNISKKICSKTVKKISCSSATAEADCVVWKNFWNEIFLRRRKKRSYICQMLFWRWKLFRLPNNICCYRCQCNIPLLLLPYTASMENWPQMMVQNFDHRGLSLSLCCLFVICCQYRFYYIHSFVCMYEAK